MVQNKKRILIVDDNMVDRLVLKSILESAFNVLEADSGNRAFEYISMMRDDLDAILLDLSMPNIDGFDVLNFMREKEINDIPVLIVSTETTKVNVQKVFQYNVSDFIKKPYNQEDVLARLRLKLGVIPEYNLTKEELDETMKYIADLEAVYKSYLANFEKNDEKYKRRSDLMQIMLNTYRRSGYGDNLNPDNIALISKAAYFCDIGEMLIPEESHKDLMENMIKNREMEEKHTIFGADLIRLNKSKACRYFVEICSSMCIHHHERYDGKGYPYRIKGKNNSIYNQMCRVLDELDERRAKFYGNKAKPIKFIIGHLVGDGMGVAGKEVYDLLEECEPLIINYFIQEKIQTDVDRE